MNVFQRIERCFYLDFEDRLAALPGGQERLAELHFPELDDEAIKHAVRSGPVGSLQGVDDRCDDSECCTCSVIACPHREPLHFHHDGCPACWRLNEENA